MPKRVQLPPDLANFTVAEGRAAGIGRKRMRSADLARPFHGARSTEPVAMGGSAAEAVNRACAAYLPLLTSTQFFSHTTAAVLWGCPLPEQLEEALPLHVATFAPERAIRREAVIGHQAQVEAVDVVVRGCFPVTDPASVLCQLSSLLTVDDLVAVADHLVLEPAVLDPRDIRPYVTLEALQRRVDAFRGRGRRAATAAIPLVRQGAESRRETQLRLLLRRAGFPEPEVNPDVRAESGAWVGRADLVYRPWKVVVEYDGDQHRTDTRQYEHDIRRIERFERAGWLVVRVRARGLTHGQADTIARVDWALGSRGWVR